MGERSASADAIVAAACRLLAELGSHDKLSLSAVAEAARVSRPTLYRWFATREDLLVAIAAHQEKRFYEGLAEALDTETTPAGRLDAALRYLVTYLDETFGIASRLIEPGMTVRSLTVSLPKQTATWVRLLGDAIARVPAVRAGELSVEQAAEIFLRLAYSHYLIPSPEPEVLLQCMRSMAGLRVKSPA
ncbi:MAG: TetR/AcrR family transcriptional regulator [Novosphingobium sp.]|nr:MAG: TetR/AcrR family transcriptional regulator [Novosphingobium sp.]